MKRPVPLADMCRLVVSSSVIALSDHYGETSVKLQMYEGVSVPNAEGIDAGPAELTAGVAVVDCVP